MKKSSCRIFPSCLVTLAVVSLLPAHAQAAPILGLLNTTGSVSFTGLTPTTTDFDPVGGGTGTFTVAAFSTGSFASIVGTTGVVKDLSSAAEPVGATVSLADFKTFSSDATIHFTLTVVAAGVFGSGSCAAPPATGQTCTPAGSAFNLTNTSTTTSTLSVSMNGTVTNSSTSEISQFAGTFTMALAFNYQTFLAVLVGGGTVQNSYSATFSVTPGAPVELQRFEAS